MADPFSPIELARGAARAVVLPYGAHVTSWTTRDGAEQLFVSERSAYTAGTAIRGGIPVIFPQFSDTGPLPRHGFARTRPWEVVRRGADTATLALRDDGATRAIWPHAFVAELTVTVDDDALAVSLGIENAGEDALAFTAALHTYLRVHDVADLAVEGLCGVRYRDQTVGGAERVDGDAALRIAGEVDRVYLDAPDEIIVREAQRARVVRADGFRDAVVWNPGAERARELADLEPDGWRRFVCVEAAAVGRPVRVAPGERWRGTQRITA